MPDKLYLDIWGTVDEKTYFNMNPYLESKFGLKDTNEVIRPEIGDPEFWSIRDQYIFEIVDEKKFVMFALKWL